MELILVLLGLALCIVGIIGSIIPVIPGLPISWVGLFLFYPSNSNRLCFARHYASGDYIITYTGLRYSGSGNEKIWWQQSRSYWDDHRANRWTFFPFRNFAGTFYWS